jgi:hypothetical protein
MRPPRGSVRRLPTSILAHNYCHEVIIHSTYVSLIAMDFRENHTGEVIGPHLTRHLSAAIRAGVSELGTAVRQQIVQGARRTEVSRR